MEKLLAAYGGAPKGLSRGQKIEGTVVEKLPKRLIVDIEAKSEGVVAEKAYDEAKKFIKGLKVGDKVSAQVIIPETPDGFTILSLRRATQEAAWGSLEEARKKDKALSVIGRGVNPSGVMVEAAGLTGFIPGSQLGKEASKNPSSLVGKSFKVKVIELDRATNKIIYNRLVFSSAPAPGTFFVLSHSNPRYRHLLPDLLQIFYQEEF